MTSVLKNMINSNLFFLVIPMILCAYTHFWNPLGFPVGPSYDENIYLRRTMNVLINLGPQESQLYDHPYFLQVFLGGILKIIGYPHSLNPIAGDIHSIEMLYLVPKLIMGALSIIDTFLIYKIAECYYNKNNNNDNKTKYNIKIAFIASVIFAVMPLTLMTRIVWLESIQLPFLLSSILFATYTKKASVKEGSSTDKVDKNKRNILILSMSSGIFLGLTIFTKMPAFTFIPLVGYLVFTTISHMNKIKFKAIVSWLSPVLSIPLIWPVYSLYSGHFSLWSKGIFFQTHRTVQSFFSSIKYDFFNIDPVFISIGFAGFIFSGVIKRDLLILLWIIPFMVFLYIIGFVSYWHFIPVFPALCIAAAKMIVDLPNITIKKKNENEKNIHQTLQIIVILAIAIFGVVSTTQLISEKTDTNIPYFKASAFIVKYLQDNENKKLDNNNGKFTLISNPFYSWIPFYVFNLHYDSIDYYDSPVSVKTKKVLLVSDPVLISRLSHNMVDKSIKKYLYGADKVLTIDANSYTTNKVVIYIHQ
ncbi:MAG TPA: hypothetical protein VJ729_05100 [Nitrososphaeraceae archaeon]|nr:hypothetical protein [Nitrososphaeraceae archaeon]